MKNDPLEGDGKQVFIKCQDQVPEQIIVPDNNDSSSHEEVTLKQKVKVNNLEKLIKIPYVKLINNLVKVRKF